MITSTSTLGVLGYAQLPYFCELQESEIRFTSINIAMPRNLRDSGDKQFACTGREVLYKVAQVFKACGPVVGSSNSTDKFGHSSDRELSHPVGESHR